MLLFFCRYENFWDIGIHLKPHLRKQLRNSSAYFSLTSASKPQTALVLYVQVWRHRDHRNRSTKWWCSTNWAMKSLTLGAGQLWVHMFPWKKWVLMIYEINPIWTAEMKWKWRNDRCSERNLCNYVKKPEKNFWTSTGSEPVTSRLPVQFSTNWAMKPLTLGAGQLWVHMFPWKEMSVNDVWNKSYMNCGNEMKMKKWSSQWTQFMQLQLPIVGSCWPTMLRPFARGLTHLKLVEIHL